MVRRINKIRIFQGSYGQWVYVCGAQEGCLWGSAEASTWERAFGKARYHARYYHEVTL